MAKKETSPEYVVALYDYNPLNNDQPPLDGTHSSITPDSSAQLTISRGEKLLVLGDTLDWWMMCRSVKSNNEGYVCSILLAPLKDERDHSSSSKQRKKRKNERKFFPDDPKLHEKKKCPRESANFFSILTFWWLNSLIATGFKRPLNDNDIWKLEDKNKAEYLNDLVEKEWIIEMEKMYKSPLKTKKVKEKRKKRNEEEDDHLMTTTTTNQESSSNELIQEYSYQPSLTKTLCRVFGRYFIVGNLQKFIHDALMLISPYLLKKLINFIEQKEEDSKWGYIYACELLGIVMVQSLFLHQYFLHAFITAMRVKSAVMTIVYRKMFKLNSAGRKKFTAGEMVNLMSVDAQKCHDVVVFLALAWSGPFQIIASLIGLYFLMGWSIMAGFFFLLLLIPVNMYIKNKEKVYHTIQMKQKDYRSKLMNEILAGIKIIKMYAWEDSFIAKVMGVRNEELKQLRNSKLLEANMAFTISCTPFLVSIVTFAAYVFIAGNVLTAEKAFVSIALFNIIRFPLFIMPILVNNIVQYRVSCKRLISFLKGEELNDGDVERLLQEDDKPVVEIQNASFSWDNYKPILKEIDLCVNRGKLIAIVGQVGTGKSSLLSAILGEIHRVKGLVRTRGDIAYVSQQPWIQNQSLRSNILFTKKYKDQKYKDIINACALESDIELLQNGDMTEIGEKGINLSGGQKQRVSLARAVYNNADIYLMDDPLSAVDSHVGKHIFEKIIGPQGLLKNKTRILVTHNLSFLPHVDEIVVLKQTGISEIGSYERLVEEGKDFADFLKMYHQKDQDSTPNKNPVKNVSISRSSENILCIPAVGFSKGSTNVERSGSSHLDVYMSASRYSLNDIPDGAVVDEEIEVQQLLDDHRELVEKTDGDNNLGGIISEEKSEVGKVNRKVYLHYFKAIGITAGIIVIVTAFCQEAALIGSRMWLAEWSSNTVNLTDSKRDYYMGIYGAIGLSQSVFALTTAYAMALGSIHSSHHLHKQLLNTILQCPMSFFETTPMGRIVNRFVKDIHSLDELIPKSIKSFLSTFMTLLGTIFIISYTTPLFLTVLLPIAFMYFLTQRFYIASSRQLKRIVSVHRSPIFNHYFESIHGASTIRAFKKVDNFTVENNVRIDHMQAAHFPSFNCDRWLAIRLEFCGNLITFFAALFCIVERENLSPGIAGLSISYALQVTQTLNWLVRMASEMETNIISVERIEEYVEKPREALPIIPDHRPPVNWPNHGAITFDNYAVRYRPGLDLVLQNTSLHVEPSEKVGIVGRTGAGKSSMTLALFRIIESANGRILVDDVDISSIGLKDLREKISIIPQDPVLFSGSIRFNIDPLMEHEDEEIWNALEVSHLKEYVNELNDGLQYEVAEGGENLSVGQRQLVCLARALLRKTKILILDEATAAVDMETDSYIQQTIRKEFKECTVLTIAHRLNTVIDYDRILVLDRGEIAEFDTPDALMKNAQSIFYGMVKDAGLLSLSANVLETSKQSE